VLDGIKDLEYVVVGAPWLAVSTKLSYRTNNVGRSNRLADIVTANVMLQFENEQLHSGEEDSQAMTPPSGLTSSASVFHSTPTRAPDHFAPPTGTTASKAPHQVALETGNSNG
jgi:hypothetical protein